MRIEMTVEESSRFSARLHAIAPEAAIVWDGAAVVVPEAYAAAAQQVMAAPLTASAAELLAYAAAKRYEREIAGTTLNGLPIRTDRETRSALVEAKAAVGEDPAWTTDWKLSNGQWLTVNAALLTQIITAVAAHRKAWFAKEKQVAVAIDAGTITTPAEIDAAFAAL